MAAWGNSSSSHYAVLGVAPDAPAAEIRSAYRRLALKCHPDKLKLNKLQATTEEEEAKARFQQIQEAYQVLSEPSSRAMYDLLGLNNYWSTHHGGSKAAAVHEDDDEEERIAIQNLERIVKRAMAAMARGDDDEFYTEDELDALLRRYRSEPEPPRRGRGGGGQQGHVAPATSSSSASAAPGMTSSSSSSSIP